MPVGCEPGDPVAVPIVCSLDQDGLASQLDGWDQLLVGVRSRSALADGGLRIELAGVAAGDVAAMAVAEQGCCPFFAFSITVDSRGLALEVRAPADASGIVADLFGRPD